MTDAIPKRREARARYDVALASWHALDAARHCRGCQDTGTIRHDEGELPCPYCRPDEAARGATP